MIVLDILSRCRAFFEEFLFPRVCLHCNSPLAESDSLFCGACRTKAQAISPMECPYCFIESVPPCPCAEFSGSGFSALYSGWVYEGPIRTMIHEVKYGHKPRLGRRLGKELAVRLRVRLASCEKVVFVPTHNARVRERSYCQAEEIARGVSMELGLPGPLKALRRKSIVSSQVKFNRQLRRENIHGSFLPGALCGRISGARVVLVDDVFTTGATLEECCRILRQEGARGVIGLTLARVPPRPPDREAD